MKNFKRVAATALSAVMALGVMNFTVFAEGKAVAKIGDVEYETLNAAVMFVSPLITVSPQLLLITY